MLYVLVSDSGYVYGIRETYEDAVDSFKLVYSHPGEVVITNGEVYAYGNHVGSIQHVEWCKCACKF